jgi:hypothetical protein
MRKQISSSGINGRWPPREPAAPKADAIQRIVAAGRAAAQLNLIMVKLPKVADNTPEIYFNTKGRDQFD